MRWLAAVEHLRERGEPGVLVTVVAVRGHAPRDAGAKMVVGRYASWDSVGGGNLEAVAVERARAMLEAGGTVPETFVSTLSERGSPDETRYGVQCCGGEVTVLLEPLPTVPPNLLANLRSVGKVMPIGGDDVVVSWLPLYHDMGLIGAWMGSLYFGVPLVLMSPLAFLVRPAAW